MRVCEERYAEGNRGKSGFYMDDILARNLQVLVKNVTEDWDFTIIISGSGGVRVGKSMLAMQIAAFLADQVEKQHGIHIPFNLKNNFVFTGANLIKKGHFLGQKHPYSPLIFDEAGADLEGRKIMQSSTQLVLDYFRECGQYNLFNILVIPEFFDLPRGIAMSRSMFLIDVDYSSDNEGKFTRGYFRFFSKRKKKYLYLRGKKELNYHAYRHDFNGRFYKYHTINEEEYKQIKLDALKKRDELPGKKNKFQTQRDALLHMIYYRFKMQQKDISKALQETYKIQLKPSGISSALNRNMGHVLVNSNNAEQ